MKEKENLKNKEAKEEVKKVKEVKEEKEETTKVEDVENENSGSYLKGILGAVIGGVVGIIPWILVYVYGNMMFSALAILIAVCEFYGYKIFKGKVDKKLPAFILGIALVLISLTVWVAIPAIIIAKTGLPINAQAFRVLYADSEFVSNLTQDFLVSAVFTLLGAGIVAGNLKRQLNEGKNDNLTINMDAALIEERKKAIDAVKPIFEKYGATSQEKTIMKEEVLAEIEDQSKSNQYFTKLKSAGIIKKHKGQYYYNEAGEANKDIKVAKKTRIIAVVVIIIAALILAILSDNETYKKQSNGLIEFYISSKWNQAYEYSDEYGYGYYRYINTTPSLDENDQNAEIDEIDFSHRPATLSVLIQSIDTSLISSVEDLKDVMEKYIKESTLIKEYTIEIDKTSNGYDCVVISVMPDGDQDSYERDCIILNGAFTVDIIANSFCKQDIDVINKDTKNIADSLRWLIDLSAISFDTLEEIEE